MHKHFFIVTTLNSFVRLIEDQSGIHGEMNIVKTGPEGMPIRKAVSTERKIDGVRNVKRMLNLKVLMRR